MSQHPVPPVPASAAVERRSPALGIAASVAVVVGILAVCLLVYWWLSAFYSAPAWMSFGEQQEFAWQHLGLWGWPGAAIAAGVGGVGWCVGIAAASARRGRGWGVAAIVLGLLSPLAV